MMRTIEAIIEEDGTVRLLEPIELGASRRALVTILETEPAETGAEAAQLSEPALAQDWDRPEEDAAWSHLPRIRDTGSLSVLRSHQLACSTGNMSG